MTYRGVVATAALTEVKSIKRFRIVGICAMVTTIWCRMCVGGNLNDEKTK
jgi:hypothetical protein